MKSAPRIPLGEILTLDCDETPIDPTLTYETVGVRSFGKGLFRRPAMRGSDSSYQRLYRIHTNQIVLSRLFAWEGAVALVPADLQDAFVSPEFPTFTVDRREADPLFVGHYVRSPDFRTRLAGATRGLGQRRKRVHPDEFLQLAIPLPPIAEQRKVAALLETWSSHVDRIAETGDRVAWSIALFDAAVQSLLDADSVSANQEPLGEVAEINPRPQRLDQGDTVTFVPMAAVDAATGEIRWPEERSTDDIRSGYKQFRRDDVIFARITPCMQNGKSAIYSGKTEFAYGSTEFHVVRPGPHVASEWLHRVLRSRGFRAAATDRFTGTAGQQRVPAAFLREARIPVPPIEMQQAVVERIDQLALRSRALTALRTRSKALQDALVPAALNNTFEFLR